MGVENITIARIYINCSGQIFQFRLDDNYGINILVNIVLYSITSLIIAVLNFLMVRIINRNKRLKKSYFLIQINSIFDFLLSILSVPVWLSILVKAYINVDVDCIYYIGTIFLIHFFSLISFFIVTLISLDKVFGTLMPFFYKRYITDDETFYHKVITGLGFFTVVVIILSFVLKAHPILNKFELFMALLLLLINIVIFVVIYCQVKNLTQQYQKRVGSTYGNLSTLKNQRKGAVSSFLFVCSLYVCYLPYGTNSVLFKRGLYTLDVSYSLALWTYYFVLLKSLCNPILYILSLKMIRVELFRKNKVNGDETFVDVSLNNLTNRATKVSFTVVRKKV